MNAQCNSCGGFFGIEKCQTCNTLICERCRTNHEIGCGQAQNMKSLGLGPTVRTVVPVLIPVEPVQSIEVVAGEAVISVDLAYTPEVIPAIFETIQEPSIELPIPITETVDGVPVVFAVDPTPIQTAIDKATGLAVFDAPFQREITAVGVSPEVIPETAVNQTGVVIVTDVPSEPVVEAQVVSPAVLEANADALSQ